MALLDSADGDADSSHARQNIDRDDNWNDISGGLLYGDDTESNEQDTGSEEAWNDLRYGFYTNADGDLVDDHDLFYGPLGKRSAMKKIVTLKLGACKKITANPPNTPESQLGGRLLKLPPEIRLMIYERMFPTDKFNINAVRGSLHKPEDTYTIAGDHVAILATCRTIYTEAKPVLYANTEFYIRIQDRYWLHYWSSDAYVRTFDVETHDDEPEQSQWIAQNPWLEDPRSIVPINNVRVLSRISFESSHHT